MIINNENEWLVSNQLGSFALGCADRVPRRKYHSLLTAREPGFGDPINVCMEMLDTIEFDEKNHVRLVNLDFGQGAGTDGRGLIKKFTAHPSPTWVYEVDKMTVTRRLYLDEKTDTVFVDYEFHGVKKPFDFELQPLMLMRPIHKLKKENFFLNGALQKEEKGFSVRPYPSLPRIHFAFDGLPAEYESKGIWYRQIYYSTEEARGYECREDTFCAGAIRLRVKKDGLLTIAIGTDHAIGLEITNKAKKPKLQPIEKKSFGEKLEEAAESYLFVGRDGFHSVIAGYPWFEHWARDTFICFPGFCLSRDRLDFADQILEDWAEVILGKHKRAQVNTSGIDSPLLFVRAVRLLSEHSEKGAELADRHMSACVDLLERFRFGGDPRVSISEDGIYVKPGPYSSGWMDAVVDGNPVTPRWGYAVDLNSILIDDVDFVLTWKKMKDSPFHSDWSKWRDRASAAFVPRFWSAEKGFFADTHDGNKACFEIRPNQLWALEKQKVWISKDIGESILRIVELELLTSLGLRTLSPKDPNYKPRYQGDQYKRDQAYHQGTVWPWLIGIYADATRCVRGSAALKRQLKPILENLERHFDQEGCIGQISEVFDAEAPHQHGGTTAQAWSIAELLRVERTYQR